MEYSVGDTLRVDGTVYDIIGKIRYKNLNDNCCWFEYRMISRGSRREKWLSYDSGYGEYSISEVTRNVSTSGYHLVDSGEEEVIGVWGNVDVEVGDRASFKEYEDRTEEQILSSEVWDDGEEVSIGYYLDLDEITFYSEDSDFGSSYSSGRSQGTGSFTNNGNMKAVIWLVVMFVVFFASKISLSSGSSSIAKYLKKTSYYTYVTSITGTENQQADVYKSSLDLDATVKDIINAIEGETEDVQQNTEDGDNSVAILTEKEYCLVYVSEDNEVLIQISTRKYAYTNDTSPYHARRHTHRYYRRYYYSRGYFSDAGSYGKYASPYSSYDDTTISSNAADTYSTYSSSVRQSSVYSRSSSGGGLSSGK